MADPLPPLTVQLTSTAYAVDPGTQVILQWIVSNASSQTTCILSSDQNQVWTVGQGAPYMHQMVCTIFETTAYTLTATDQYGQTGSASVTIQCPAVIVVPARVAPDIDSGEPSWFNGGAPYPAGVYSIDYLDGAYQALEVPYSLATAAPLTLLLDDTFDRPNTTVGGPGSTTGLGNGWIDVLGGTWDIQDDMALASAQTSYVSTWGLLNVAVRPPAENYLNQRVVIDLPANANIRYGNPNVAAMGVTRYQDDTGNGPSFYYAQMILDDTPAMRLRGLQVLKVVTGTSVGLLSYVDESLTASDAYEFWIQTYGKNPTYLASGYTDLSLESAYTATVVTDSEPVLQQSGRWGMGYNTQSGSATMLFSEARGYAVAPWYVGQAPAAGYAYQEGTAAAPLAQSTTGFATEALAVDANAGGYTLLTLATALPIGVGLTNALGSVAGGSPVPTYQLNPPVFAAMRPAYQEIVAGQPALLQWQSNGAATTMTPQPGALTGTAGTVTVAPAVSTGYVLAGSSPGLPGATSQTCVVEVTPLAAAALTASPLCGGRIALAWESPAQPFTSYTLSRSADGAGFSVLASGLAAAGYIDTPPSALTRYWYRVTVVNNGQESPDSNTASAIGLAQPPAAPTVTATPYPGAIAVQGSPVPYAASYVVYRGPTSAEFGAIATVGTPYYYDMAVAGSTAQWVYKMWPANGCGMGVLSEPATATPLPSAPAPAGGPPPTTYYR